MNDCCDERYITSYNKARLFRKITAVSEKISGQLVYALLVLYELISNKNIPLKARLLFMAALGYFIVPTDMISDFIPILGFTDDVAFISYALSKATDFISPEIAANARRKKEGLMRHLKFEK